MEVNYKAGYSVVYHTCTIHSTNRAEVPVVSLRCPSPVTTAARGGGVNHLHGASRLAS